MAGCKWDGLKKIRVKFAPSFTRLTDAQGRHAPSKLYPNKATDYLDNMLWKARAENPGEETIQHRPVQNGSYLADDTLWQMLNSIWCCRKWLRESPLLTV